MKIYRDISVLDAAKQRIRWVLTEFPNFVVAFSGGKDSTVVLNLTIEVAREMGRLPVRTMWIDQEAEWQMTVDYVRAVMHRPEVEPWWFQMPIRISNSTSETQDWLRCWAPGAKWMREREPDSIHENTFGTDRFYELFDAIIARRFPGQKAAVLGGVRCEESMSRTVGLTTHPTYKHVTWGKQFDKRVGQFAFYPLYDWSWRDVWVAIHRHGWPYCRLYDVMFQHGVPTRDMRVSNVHHETAISHLHYLQEFEPQTWNRLTERLGGVNTLKHLGAEFIPTELPPMFRDWRDYRDHLLANLIHDPAKRAAMRTKFADLERRYAAMHDHHSMVLTMVRTVLVGDHFGTKLANWENRPEIVAWRQYQKGKRHPSQATNPHIFPRQAKP